MNKKFLSLPSRFLGIAALFAGLYLMIGSIPNYTEQYKQRDWVVVNAAVSDVSSRVVSRGAQHRSSTVYDITYQYEVDGTYYTNELKGSSVIHLVGDSIKIKYDPNEPANATTILSPNISDLLIPFGAGVVFFVSGFFLSGFYGWLRSLRKKTSEAGDSEEGYIEAAYTEELAVPGNPKKGSFILLQRIIPLFLLAGMILFSFKVCFQTKAIGIEQFAGTMKGNGYGTADTTEKIRQEWKIGSLLEESCSVETDDIRIDFCMMDSVGSARSLYNGMNLPVSDGAEQNHNRINYNFTSMENEILYTVKIRVGNTVIYGASQIEQKQKLIGLLERIEYWTD